MQSTRKLFQVVLLSENQVRPSRWFPRESLAKRFCLEFNQLLGPGRAVATYYPVELPQPEKALCRSQLRK